MLGFETECGAKVVGLPTFTFFTGGKEVARIELKSGLGGPHFHNTTGGGLRDRSRKREFSTLLIQHQL